MSMTTDSHKILGRELQVQRTVGSGGFGDVLLTTRMRMDAHPRHGFTFPPQCVVKVMRVGLCGQTELELAQREVRVLKTLTHPNIVCYIGSWIERSRGPYQNRFCIALQYCEGGDVAALIRTWSVRKQPLPAEVVVRLMAQVFSALNYSHSRHLIHRDIKPGNVFLTGCGDNGVGDAVVGDFGLVRSLEVTCETVASRVGTPSYVSPEIVAGEAYTAKTDIFSAGAMFYELLTYHSPFWRRGLSQQENFKRVLHYDPMPHMRAHAGTMYGPALTNVVAACLAKVEKQRASAYDILVRITSPVSVFVRNNAIPVYVVKTISEASASLPAPPPPPPAARASPPSASAVPHHADPTVEGSDTPRKAEGVREALIELFMEDRPSSATGQLASILCNHSVLYLQLRVLLAFYGDNREELMRQLRNLLRSAGLSSTSALAMGVTGFINRHFDELMA